MYYYYEYCVIYTLYICNDMGHTFKVVCTMPKYLSSYIIPIMYMTLFIYNDFLSYFGLCAAHFTDSHVDYTNKVCWVTNNYYLPFDSRVPREGAPRRVIAYYQWVGLFLMVQGVIFYLPRPIWRLLNKKSGKFTQPCMRFKIL